jgi:hypothetical protein
MNRILAGAGGLGLCSLITDHEAKFFDDSIRLSGCTTVWTSYRSSFYDQESLVVFHIQIPGTFAHQLCQSTFKPIAHLTRKCPVVIGIAKYVEYPVSNDSKDCLGTTPQALILKTIDRRPTPNALQPHSRPQLTHHTPALAN